MRRAHTDVDWLTLDSGEVIGITLGFDFCAEHEHGVPFFKDQLGIECKPYPLGVEDRTQTLVPENLRWLEYAYKPKPSRVKKAPLVEPTVKSNKKSVSIPAALLFCVDFCTGDFSEMSFAKKAEYLGAQFYSEPGDKWHIEGKSDLASTWSGNSGFALHVRGAENVKNLRAVYDAFLQRKIALADPSFMGFMRKSLAFVDSSRIPEESKCALRANDVAFLRLVKAADDTGVEVLLNKAGKRFHALSPRWREGEGSELLFYLNPHEQSKYSGGWLTVKELQQWAHDTGPVVENKQIEAILKEQDRDWGFHLHMGLEAAGIKLNAFEQFVWLDPKKTKIGVRLLISKNSTSKELEDGIHPLEKIQPYVESGKALRAAQELAKAHKDIATQATAVA